MALGGAPLVLTLCLRVWLVSGYSLSKDYENDTAQVGAPSNLLALIPEAAAATVAAGYGDDYLNFSQKSTNTPSRVSSSVSLGTGTVVRKEAVLSEGDSHYAWKAWGEWHCNCAAGSMSRVRDITYSVPNVHLDPAKYNALSFERVVCNYQTCRCRPGQCNRSAVSCAQGPMRTCAMQDIQQGSEHKTKEFWAKVHQGLRDLWKSIKEALPPKQEPKFAKQQRQSLSIALSKSS